MDFQLSAQYGDFQQAARRFSQHELVAVAKECERTSEPVPEAVRRVAINGAQVMSACGYSKDYAMERKMRDAWVWGIGGGHIDLQKANITGALVGRRFSQR